MKTIFPPEMIPKVELIPKVLVCRLRRQILRRTKAV